MSVLSQSRIHLQFHITGNCNLQCKHCYRTEGNVEPLSTEDIKNIIDQFIDLRNEYNKEHNIRKRGHINLTGGEPFIRKDIKEIINYIHHHDKLLTYGVLSNGSFINDDIIDLLKSTNVSFVQLSIDGNRETHDELRACGDYDRVFRIAKKLTDNGIRVYISFTANAKNYTQLPKVASECRKNKITALWSDRIVPIGNAEDLQDLIITKDLLPDYISTLKKSRGSKLTQKIYKSTEVRLQRALQFLGDESTCYECSAAKSLMVVDEFGRIMPCRRLPIYCGDVFKSTLTDIYYNHPIFIDLRTPYIPSECITCHHNMSCNGGAKCQSYAVFGTYKKADPSCPLTEQRPQ